MIDETHDIDKNDEEEKINENSQVKRAGHGNRLGELSGPAAGQDASREKAQDEDAIDDQNDRPEAACPGQGLPTATNDIEVEQSKNGEGDGKKSEKSHAASLRIY